MPVSFSENDIITFLNAAATLTRVMPPAAQTALRVTILKLLVSGFPPREASVRPERHP
jgi:hypothetical protein